jgi:hypothetical protein
MSFTWNGLVVNDVRPIVANYSIPEYYFVSLTASEIAVLKNKIKSELAIQIADQISNNFEIEQHLDPTTNSKIFYAKVYMADVKKTHPPLTNPTTVPMFNGTATTLSYPLTTNNSTVTITGSSTKAYTQEYEKFRVCEYTKNSKVTRVELQRYQDGMWVKIPRIQIEE